MNTLLEILTHDILPIFVVIGLGFAFARRTNPDIRFLSKITFYILSPSLVFSSLIKSNVEGGEVVQIAAFVIGLTLVMSLAAWSAARWMRFDARQTAGFILAVTFVNAGNYGLGVNRLAFGADAEARAVIYFVTSSVLVYTVGVSIATGFKGGWRGTLKQLLSMPHPYVLVLVMIIRATRWPVPEPILEGINFPAQAAIPLMLLLLGIQLSGTSVSQYRRPAVIGSVLSLIVAPLLAFGLASVIGLTGVARQAAILQASMPAAVINTLLATEFQTEPKLVTGTVVISTILSPITLTLIIALLK
ncbi:MAG: AEC family transporter [Anaerolineae bacterium]